ncbi:MAG TPA: uroporphyrinogen-III synthase [Candidatus Limnocylindrales bacterium]|nr:uroporphyrinogen-III synthase [Candidatus Limnocylindrales bacterium]
MSASKPATGAKKSASGNQEEPLSGWRILTTRASKQSDGLAAPLREIGAEVIEIPTIEIKPPSSYKSLDAALKNIAKYDWLILTSVNGVEALFARLKKLRIAPAKLAHLQVAAIGPATQREIEKQGLKVAVTPDRYVAEAVAETLEGKTEGKRVLLVRAKVARDVLPIELRKAGAKVDVAEAYETHVPKGSKAKLNRLFSNDTSRPDIVTFTSSSTATNFLSLLEKDHWHGLREIWLASIGPVTSDALRQAGFRPNIEALEYTMEGLALAIAKHVLTTHPSE